MLWIMGEEFLLLVRQLPFPGYLRDRLPWGRSLVPFQREGHIQAGQAYLQGQVLGNGVPGGTFLPWRSAKNVHLAFRAWQGLAPDTPWGGPEPPLRKLLGHRLREGLLFQLGTDSSSSPNLLLSNTTCIHSAPNLSLCLNFCVAFIPPFSHPSPT